MGRALGAKAFKLIFGHRGGNHPVRDLQTGRIHITVQNHGYALDADSLGGKLDVNNKGNDNRFRGHHHRPGGGSG
ncbi:MAG: hypothetical protein KAW13_06045 [Dehalococcoidia bacterium]|nr:hypothetical protein [Dehalococcoidia bacterium]